MASIDSSTKPSSITGGCLCGLIRYTITIPSSAPWPLTRNSICQCTACRKFTGSLLPHDVTIPTSWISPALKSNESLKTYRSSAKGERSFCSTCGSSIAFNYVGNTDETDIMVGGIDEEFWKGPSGPGLARAGSNIWMENAVKGVTDGLPGPKWLKDSSGPPLEEEKRQE